MDEISQKSGANKKKCILSIQGNMEQTKRNKEWREKENGNIIGQMGKRNIGTKSNGLKK